LTKRLETHSPTNCISPLLPSARFPYPTCGRLRKPQEWKQLIWRHLNFFQHACIISARVPRTDYLDHSLLRIKRTVGTPRQRLHPAVRAGRSAADARDAGLRLRGHRPAAPAHPAVLCPPGDRAARSGHVEAIALDETAARRGHEYVTLFIDLDAAERPVLFVTPGRGKDCVTAFRDIQLEHGGEPTRAGEVVCDMSAAFLAASADGPQVTNARLEALNGLFQAARARARGYRTAATFACIVCLIGAPITELLGQTCSIRNVEDPHRCSRRCCR